MPATAKRTAKRPATSKKAPATRSAAKKAPAKKATPRKAAAKKTAASDAPTSRTRKTTAKKSTATKTISVRKTTKKGTAPKAAAMKAPAKRASESGTDPFGFINGTDSSIAAHALVEGGASRLEVNEKVEQAIRKANGGSLQTRGGRDKVIPTIVGNVFLKLKDQGYNVESSWRLIPPADVRGKVAAEKRKVARRKAASKK